MQIEEIREYVAASKIRWSQHCLSRMQERDISRADVENCIMHGEIIEDYPTDFPHPSCLIFGHKIDNAVIHVVAGKDERFVYLISAYYPNTDKFEHDLKTRRR